MFKDKRLHIQQQMIELTVQLVVIVLMVVHVELDTEYKMCFITQGASFSSDNVLQCYEQVQLAISI